MSDKYLIEKNLCRQDSLDGAAPVESCSASTLAEAKSIMHTYADGGQYYAAVFINRDGECIGETDDVD